MPARCSQIFGPAASLALLVLMKLANQFATFNYRLFNFNTYELVNGSSSVINQSDQWQSASVECRLKSPDGVQQASADQVQTNFMRWAYTLAAVGGLLSSATRNRRLVLTLAGCAMTLSAIGVCIVRAFGLACSWAAYVLAWLPHPVYMILVLAPLLAAFGDCRCQSFGPDGGRTVALVLYYAAASSTIWFNMGVWKLADVYMYQGSHVFVAVAAIVLGIAYLIACRLICPSAAAAFPRRQFELPTMRRLLRYFLILSAFTLFILQLNDGHIVGYQREALHYMNPNATEGLGGAVLAAFRDWNVPRTVNIVGMLMSSALVAVMAGSRRIRSSHMLRLTFQTRLLFGISLAAIIAAFGLASDLCIRAISSDGLAPLLPALIFSFAGFVEGFVKIFAMVAAYELVLAIAPASHRDFLVGIALSVWSFASLLRSALYSGIVPLIISPEAAKQDPHASYCLRHAIDLLLCVSCLAYTRLVSLPLAAPLMAEERDIAGAFAAIGENNTDAEEHEDSNEELQHLLS
ncbi:hypothetical protein BOX15_Mlig027601g1 [Macrostomum lignano]|uniref:Uncharacterized protein n=1 Tax=Macrostomum lignano TaxID=282301 RepID=A0A267F8V8_9PLAT|nr:hypothetical protein BOX15_Mlig027601g1 [Macrostomum lignano]